MNNEPGLGKNYWLAFILSFVILISYPYILKYFYPTPPASETIEPQPAFEPESVRGAPETAETKTALTPAEGPFIEPPVKPAVVPYKNANYDIEFSTLGGSMTRLFYRGEPGKEHFTENTFYEGDPALPGLFGIRILHEAQDLTRIGYKAVRSGKKDEAVGFEFEKPGEYRLRKRYTFDPNFPVIYLQTEVTNLTGRQKHVPMELEFAMDYQGVPQVDHRFVESVIQSDKVKTANVGKIAKKGYSVSESLEWAGLMKKYFTVLVRADWNTLAFDVTEKNEHMFAKMRMEPFTLAAGESQVRNFLIYAGPQQRELLKEFGFEGLISRGWFGVFKVWILEALKFFYKYTGNYGWAIILVTLIIKGLFTPLTHMSFENMKKMQAIQPKIKSLQERHKKDPEKMNKEMMEIYRRNKVNPMMGCLPMVLQIPIFIAFYQGLAEAIELKGAPFIFWIHDLAEPDKLMTLPFSIPFLGDGLNILPLLMIGSMVWQQKLTPTAAVSPEQAKMMNMLPIIFGFMFYAMPSGLVLYWFVNNVLSIIHQVFVKKIVVVLHHEDKE